MIHQIEQSPHPSSLSPSAKRKQNAQILKQMDALEGVNRDLRELSAQLLELQDQERRMIARHLNDVTGQELAALSVQLAVLFRNFGNLDLDLASSLMEVIRVTKHACDELQTISYLLHPPLLDEMGLPMALRWYLDGFGKQSKIQVELELSENFGRLPQNLEIAIFRVAQECLANVHRHAQNSSAAIRLHHSTGKITLEVLGRGSAASEQTLVRHGESGLDLRSVEQRVKDFNGEMEISARPKATHIRVSIPVPNSSLTL